MRCVHGIWLPDLDTHFEQHFARNETYKEGGTYQLDVIRRAIHTVQHFRLAVDVGAHVGLWSRVLAGAFDTVIAFEPNPDSAECFSLNLANEKHVSLRQSALSCEAGQVSVATDARNSGMSHIATPSELGLIAEAITLDSLGLNIVDLIKIDVEGWEVNVLKGAESTIRANKPIIILEQIERHSRRYGFDGTECSRLLEEWGAKELWNIRNDYCFGWDCN